MTLLVDALKRLLSDVGLFSWHAGGVRLRSYQLAAARAIADSVIQRRGLTFVVAISRQGGKNEMQAAIESFLLTALSRLEWYPQVVKVSPTFKPQTLNAMARLERVLSRNLVTQGIWKRRSGYIYAIGRAAVSFFSAHRSANVVGATASALLEVDEAQDVLIAKFDKEFAPMAASTNATQVFFGTVWTARTLLARELKAARVAEAADGVRRVFLFDCAIVGAEVPAYAEFVKKQVAKLGRQHPLVKTQYFLEEIGAEGGMFPPERLALMVGRHSRQRTPVPGKIYAFLIDVAGADEDGSAGSPDGTVTDRESRRDSTALTIVEVDTSTLGDELIRAPRYLAVERVVWTGVKHSALYGRLAGLIDAWGPRYAVIDATGLGQGLASFLMARFGNRILPFVFSQQSKSALGWSFLAVCDTGRWQEWRPSTSSGAAGARDEAWQFWRELEHCQYDIAEGAGKVMRWGVPDGARDDETGELLHDDLIMSAALCARLDEMTWPTGLGTTVIAGVDPLEEMSHGF